SDLSVDFCDARQGGRSLWKNASGAAFFALCLFAHMFFRPYPLILWITVSPFLSKQTPLAAVERPSAASQ
ncbi:hypothetical protein OH729_08480, partial [Escherichia coli]|nr:hypothetical protein [Escherichia coli]